LFIARRKVAVAADCITVLGVDYTVVLKAGAQPVTYTGYQ